MNTKSLIIAKGHFDEVVRRNGDTTSIDVLARGLSSFTDALLELQRDIEAIKTATGRYRPTDHLGLLSG